MRREELEQGECNMSQLFQIYAYTFLKKNISSYCCVGVGGGTTPAVVTEAAPTGSDCKDTRVECPGWLIDGYCDDPNYKDYMRRICCKSCKGETPRIFV